MKTQKQTPTQNKYNSDEVTDIIECEEFVTHNIEIKDKNTIIADGRVNIYIKNKCYSSVIDKQILKCI